MGPALGCSASLALEALVVRVPSVAVRVPAGRATLAEVLARPGERLAARCKFPITGIRLGLRQRQRRAQRAGRRPDQRKSPEASPPGRAGDIRGAGPESSTGAPPGARAGEGGAPPAPTPCSPEAGPEPPPPNFPPLKEAKPGPNKLAGAGPEARKRGWRDFNGTGCRGSSSAWCC